MQRFLSHIGLVALATVSAAPLPVLSDEAADRGYLEALLEDSLSSGGHQVDIVGFSGALSSKATIEALHVADAGGIWLSLEGIELDWNRAALLSGQIDVNTLSAARIEMPRQPLPDPNRLPEAEAPGFALPELPVSVELGALTVAEAHFGAAVMGQELSLALQGTAQLASGEGSVSLNVVRLDQPEAALSFFASYANSTRELTLDLSLFEPSGGILVTQLDIPEQPSLDLKMAGQGPLTDFTATLALHTDGIPRLTGDLTLIEVAQTEPGSEALHQFRTHLEGDIAPLFLPEYRDFFGPNLQLRASGQRSAERLSLDQLELTAQALSLSGKAEIEQGWPVLLDLKGTIANQAGTPVLLPLSGPRTEVQAVDFALTYDHRLSQDWDLQARLDRFSRPGLQLATLDLSGKGQLRTGGVAGGLRLNTQGLALDDAALAQALGRSLLGRLTFAYETDTPLHLHDIAVTGETFDASGEIEIAGLRQNLQLAIAPKLRIRAADLTRYAALAATPLSGQAELSVSGQLVPLAGEVALALHGKTQDLALGDARLDPYLAGAGKLDLLLARDEEGTHLAPFHITTDQARITLNADFRRRDSRLDLEAELIDVAPLLEGVTGAARLSLAAEETAPNDWQTRTVLTAPGNSRLDADLLIQEAHLDSRRLAGTLHLQSEDLRPYQPLVGHPLAGALTLDLSGDAQPEDLSFDLDFQAEGQDLASGFEIVDRLIDGTSTLSFAIRRRVDGQVLLRDLKLATPEVQAKLTGEGSLEDPVLNFDARLSDIALLGAGINGPLSSQGQARLEGDLWQIDSQLQGPAGSTLRTLGQLAADLSRADLSIRGQAPLALANPLIRPRLLQGDADFDLRLNGPLKLSALSGQISTVNSRLALPNLRQALEAISGNISLGAGRAVLALQAKLGNGGALTLSGPVSLENGNTADLTLNVRNAVALDPTLFRAELDGDLFVRGSLRGGASVTGTLQLGQTELRIPSNGGPRFASLPGLVHQNIPASARRTLSWAGLVETSAPSSSGPAYGLDLSILAPSRIFVRGRGLDAELGGALRLSGTSHEVVPQGQFDLIRGRLDILGKRLTLSEGRIQLQGAFDPFIRFVAQTTTGSGAATTQAEIKLEGPASSPALSFASVPQLPEDEILALLLFGRGITTISPLQAVRLAVALRTLAGQGGQGITGKLRSGLALDDLDVATTDEGATQARVGKYVTENIYTEITADSLGNSRIDLNLSLSRGLTARGSLSSDGETGLGLFLEKDY